LSEGASAIPSWLLAFQWTERRAPDPWVDGGKMRGSGRPRHHNAAMIHDLRLSQGGSTMRAFDSRDPGRARSACDASCPDTRDAILPVMVTVSAETRRITSSPVGRPGAEAQCAGTIRFPRSGLDLASDGGGLQFDVRRALTHRFVAPAGDLREGVIDVESAVAIEAGQQHRKPARA